MDKEKQLPPQEQPFLQALILLLFMFMFSPFFFIEVSRNSIGAAYSDDVSYVFRRAATGQVKDRFVKALNQRSESRCIGKALNHLVTDISSIEVREDEDVGMAGNGRAGSLVFADFRNEGSVSLHFTVKSKIDVAFFQDFNSFADVFNGFTGAGTHRGVRQEGNLRIEDLNGTTGTFDTNAGDISQLICRRIGDNAAVTEDEDTIVAVLRSVRQENECRGYGLVARAGADDLKAGTDNFCRRRSSTGYAAVSFAESDETSRKEGVVVSHDVASFFNRHAFLFAAFCKVFAKFIHPIVRFRIDDFNTSEIDLEFSSIFFDLFQFTYENDFSKTISQNAFSSFQDTTAVRFRKDNFLLGLGNTGF